jgi:putative transposase
MSRPVRIEFPGAHYHLTSKGNSDQQIFLDNEDRAAFLQVIDCVVGRFGWLLHSYVMMDRHYHLVVECPQANLSKGMRQLNGVYTQHFNRRHGQDGPLFQGRFKSVLFEPQSYLLPLCRHVELNPVRLSASKLPQSYPWSSFRATVGVVKAPCWLHSSTLLANFEPGADAQKQYRDYVKAGIGAPSPLAERSAQVLLGSTGFLNEMQPILNGEKLAKRGPKRAGRRRTLANLFRNIEDKTRLERNELIRRAHIEHSYTLMEIGDFLGLHYTTVSKVINQQVPAAG